MSFSSEIGNSALLSPSVSTAPHYEQGLLGLANATRVLLRHSNLSAAFPRALEHLRVSLQVERLYLCEHQDARFRLRFEALSPSTPSRFTTPSWQGQSYRVLGLSHWLTLFSEHRNIGGPGHHFSAAEQNFLELRRGKFAWLTPIHLPEGEFWGFLGCEHRIAPAHFGSCEQPLLLSLADNMGCAIGRQRNEQRIQHQAFHDPLTELPNRMLFNDRLALALAHARRTQEAVAVMFLDLDRFKHINDSLGHDYGDELLVQATLRLKSCLRGEDILARWGGDEFTLCLPNLQSSDDVSKVCQRLLAELRRPFEIQQATLEISGSIGIALFPQDGQDIVSLLRQADTALYRVKQSGRDHYQFFQSAMNSLMVEKLAWADRLRQALQTLAATPSQATPSIMACSLPQATSSLCSGSGAAQEFEVFYQPLVKLSEETASIYALEALLRWRHPARGLLSAAAFLPYAEQAGLMVQLGHWLVESVSAHARDWQKMGLPLDFISINLSLQQLQSSALMSKIVHCNRQLQAIDLNGVNDSAKTLSSDPAKQAKGNPGPQLRSEARDRISLAIELDENSAYTDFAYTKRLLADFRDNGIRNILQQTSSKQLQIEALVSLPLYRLKLAPSLLQSRAKGGSAKPNRSIQHREQQTLAAFLAFAQQLSLPTIAQKVETDAQVEQLRLLQCPEAQGHRFGSAMSAADITQVLQEQLQSQN